MTNTDVERLLKQIYDLNEKIDNIKMETIPNKDFQPCLYCGVKPGNKKTGYCSSACKDAHLMDPLIEYYGGEFIEMFFKGCDKTKGVKQ